MAAADAADPDTVVLTSSNFDSFINEEGPSLVEFYAPWCGHCKSLAPEYAKAATALKKLGIKLGKVDATEEGDIASRYDVKGYPTMKIFRSGTPSDYEGPRDAAGIISFLKKQSGPSAKPFDDVDAAKKHAAAINAPVILGHFATSDSAAAKTFVKVANAERDNFEFAIVTGAKKDTITRVFPKTARFTGEDLEAAFDGALTSADAVTTWAYVAALPLVGVQDAETAALFQKLTVPVVTVFAQKVDPALDPSGTKYLLNRIRAVAKKYAGKIQFALSAKDNAQLELVPDALNVAIIGADGAKYRLNDPPATFKKDTKEVIASFVDDFLNGKLEQFLKSEPVPETQGDVTVLVAKNFEAETAGKPGLVEFYAPWCGHCKTLEPKWDKLGKKAKADAPGVLIGKMDATANDVPPGFDVQGFPTIYYVDGKGGKEQYQGGRETKNFVSFLKSKGHW